MERKINSYKELIVWQKSIDLLILVYSITKKFPDSEKFGLISQMRRAAVSVPSNIAEGWGRESSKNYVQFLRISRGSLLELETLLIISEKLQYLDNLVFEEISNKLTEVSKILNGFIKSINSTIEVTKN